MHDLIAVVGAGVSGLTSAIALAERGHVTNIFAAETGARTTSAAAGAIWFPYDAEPADRVVEWSLRTYELLRELSHVRGSGVSMIELQTFARAGEVEIPTWALPLGARRLSREFVPPLFTSGFALTVPLADTTIYLAYLAERFRQAGGEIVSGVHFKTLDEVDGEYSLVVNCSGLGARELVRDPELEPHRGQVVLVPRLTSACAIVCDDPPLMYAIPRTNDCVFGGTNQLSEDRAPDANETAAIVDECSRALGIAQPQVLAERVGLRPYRRAGICLRADCTNDGRRVIHNYGHGGSGFTLSWGCTEEVLALTELL